jgi:hypothetical protein
MGTVLAKTKHHSSVNDGIHAKPPVPEHYIIDFRNEVWEQTARDDEVRQVSDVAMVLRSSENKANDDLQHQYAQAEEREVLLDAYEERRESKNGDE